MYEFSPLDSNYSDKHVLVEKKTEAQAASNCSVPAQTIAQRTVVGECLYPPDESSIPELPCDTCTVFLDIEVDNEEPVIGCEGQDEVNYTITLCNYCQADTFNLEVVQFNPEDEILLTQGLNVSGTNDRFIRVDDIVLDFDQCYELSFTTQVVDVATLLRPDTIGDHWIAAAWPAFELRTTELRTCPVLYG